MVTGYDRRGRDLLAAAMRWLVPEEPFPGSAAGAVHQAPSGYPCDRGQPWSALA